MLTYLQQQHPQVKIAIIWDGASYHLALEFQEYLEQVNLGTTEQQWLITCIRLAPHAPEQNPCLGCLVAGEEIFTRVLASLQKFQSS